MNVRQLPHLLNGSLRALGAAVLLSATLTATARDRFVFALPNAVNITVAPISFAQELGYFDAEGIALELPVLIGSGVIIPQLMNGSVHATYIALEPLAVARQPGGPNFAFRYGYNFARSSLYEIVVLDSSNVKTVADLAGKTVGVGGISWGNVAGTKGMLSAAGVDLASVKFAAVGDGTPALEALRRGQVDALNLYDTKHIQFEQAGVKLRRLQLPPPFAGISSNGIPFTDKLMAEQPALVGRFGRALTKGLVACDAAIDNCVRAYWKRYPDKKPAAAQEAETLAKERELLRARLNRLITFRADEPRQFGAFSDADWLPTLAAMKAAGVISNADIRTDTLYTNRFVPEFNAFDPAAVANAARAYKP